MKIRNSSRITAIVLALVMLLPLISIPTFAEVDPEKIIWSEDFTSYEGLEGDALKAKVKKNWFQSANNMEVKTEDGDTYLRFPIQALVTGTKYDVPYYAYNDKYAHFLDQNKAYSGIKSYDHETGTLVFANANPELDDLTIQVDTTKANTAGDMFGTFSYGGTDYKLATGEYAACSRFGDGNCIDRYAHIYFGERTLYTEEDDEVLAGTKKVGDVKAEPAGISYVDYDKVVITYKAMIEPDSIGKLNMQLNQFDESTDNHADNKWNQNFVELGDLDLATGDWAGGALSGAKLPIGEWVELYFIVDLKAATIQGVMNGKAYGVASCGNKGDGGIILSGWSISKVMKAEPMKLQGAWLIDDVQVLTGDAAGGLIQFSAYENNFDSANIGDNIPGVTGVSANYKIAADPKNPNNKVWALGHADSTGANVTGGARDANARISHELFTAEMNDYFTLSADYYIPTGTGNQFQTQFLKYNGVKGGAVAEYSWGDIFVVRSMNGVATVGREGDPDAYQVPYDTWFTVTVEYQMSTNTYDIYVNGSVAMAGQKIGVGIDAMSSIGAANIIMGKQNKAADKYLAGTMYLDNISMKAGQYDGAFSSDDVWTEDALYADALAFDFTNEEVDALGIFSASNAYSFPNSLIFVDADEDFTPDAIQLDIKSTAVADDPATEEDETVAEGAIDKMVRPNHVGISTKKASMAVLSANYIVSEDAQGKIQAELHDNAWENLFILDADASTIEGVAFTKGEEFNVTVVLDFATGTISTYYNNLLIYTKTDVAIVKNGLSSAEWSVAKIMKDCEAYAGSIVVDDMTITAKLADDKSENVLYLYDQENMVAVEDIVPTTVDAASIRLFAPTGLRFAAKLNNASVLSSATKIGMLIAPAQYVTDAGAFTKEALETLPYVTTYLDIEAEVGNYFKGNGSTANLGEGDFITASIVNILDKNISRDFAAIAYVEVAGQIYYASEYTVANVQAIAQAAQDAYVGSAYENIVNAYANGVKPAY